MRTRYSLYISVLALGACASPPATVSNVAEPVVVYADVDAETIDEVRAAAAELELNDPGGTDGVVCRREQKTGTHLRRVVCRSERDLAVMRESSQEWLRSGGIEGGPVVAR